MGQIIGWTIAATYMLVGGLTGRRAAREFYVRQEPEHHRRYPSLTYGKSDRDTAFSEAIALFFLILFAWPCWMIYKVARRSLAHAIPEYESAELEDKIRQQKAEIERLHREMGLKPPPR